ncbi:MAG: alpha/beta hydrolase, partial [Burkholderiales bacterium]
MSAVCQQCAGRSSTNTVRTCWTDWSRTAGTSRSFPHACASVWSSKAPAPLLDSMTAHDTVALAPVDPVIQEIQQQIKAAGCSQADPTTLSIAEAREQQSRYFGFVNRNLPPIGRTQDLSIQTRGGAISARLYRPEDARTDFFAVFARGAGWWAGDLDSHEGACREVAQALGRCVVALDYRRSPEHVFPAQLDDVTDAAAWLIQHARQLELHSQRVVLWGESAGATLM